MDAFAHHRWRATRLLLLCPCRREITYGGPEIVEECSWEEDWCQCGSCSYRSEAEGIEEVLVCDACTHVADFYPDSLDQPALIDGA